MNIHLPHPEHELVRLAMKARYCQAEAAFVAWLIEVRGYVLAIQLPSSGQLHPTAVNLEQLVAEYHGIDLAQLEIRRRELIRETKGKA